MATQKTLRGQKYADRLGPVLRVGTDLFQSDFATIQEGLDELGAKGGGTLVIGPGTFSIGTTLTMPDAPVRVVGQGREATILDIGSNAIFLFTMGFARQYEFADFTILGDSAAGGTAFRYSGPNPSTDEIVIERVNVGDTLAAADGVDSFFTVSAGQNVEKVTVVDCDIRVSSLLFSIGSTTSMYMSRVRAATGARFTSSNPCFLVDCDFEDAAGGWDVGPDSVITGTTFNPTSGATLTLGNNCKLIGCTFVGTAGATSVTVSSNDCVISGCRFATTGATTAHVSITAAAAACRIADCDFGGVVTQNIDVAGNGHTVIGCLFDGSATASDVRVSGTNNLVTACLDCSVIETGGANSNHYKDLDLANSTIIGAATIIEDKNVRTVTTTPVTLTQDDRTVDVDASGGARVINLPAAATARYVVYTIRKSDSSTNTVTIDASGAETINDQTTLVLDTEFETTTIQSTGTEWVAVAGKGAGVAASLSVDWVDTPPPSPAFVSEDEVFGWELPDAVTRGVVTTILTPKAQSFQVNPVLRVPYMASVAGANANVEMRLTVRYIADGELTSKVADETLTQTVAVVGTDKRVDQMSFTLDASLMAASDKINFRLDRLGADANDTFTGRIAILRHASRLDYKE